MTIWRSMLILLLVEEICWIETVQMLSVADTPQQIRCAADTALKQADIVIMTDEPLKIASAIKISRKTLRIVRQNIVFALAIKGLVLLLGVMGMATMWEAVFADVGVSVLAILNSLRALSVKK